MRGRSCALTLLPDQQEIYSFDWTLPFHKNVQSLGTKISVASRVNELQIDFAAFFCSFCGDARCYKQRLVTLSAVRVLVSEIIQDSEAIDTPNFSDVRVALSVRFDFDPGVSPASQPIA